jgi:hypothetical protein
MTNERFNHLLNEGALFHPMIPFQITRLAMALKYVVDGCGKQGSDMLEAWCQARDEQDSEHENLGGGDGGTSPNQRD